MSQIVNNNVVNKKKWRNNKIPNYYLPKSIKNTIISGFEDKLSKSDFNNKIYSLNIKKSKPLWLSAIIFVIHQAASRDSLDILEHYIKRESPNKELFANATFGTNNYTPIFRAAYLGSLKCLKSLVACGANIDNKNNKNETIYDAINQGCIDSINKDPDNKVFHNHRFNECEKWLNDYKIFLTKKKPEFKINFKKFKIKKKKSVVNKKKFIENNISKNKIFNSYLNNKIKINIVIEFLNKYQSTKNINELIKKWILAVSEKNKKEANSICKLIHNLILYNIISKEDINIIFDTDLLDIIKFDAPFCKKYVTKLCDLHNINLNL